MRGAARRENAEGVEVLVGVVSKLNQALDDSARVKWP
jgi:hypothetical protein